MTTRPPMVATTGSGASRVRHVSHSILSGAPQPAHSTGSTHASASSTASRALRSTGAGIPQGDAPARPEGHGRRLLGIPLLLRAEEGGDDAGVLPAAARGASPHAAVGVPHPDAV